MDVRLTPFETRELSGINRNTYTPGEAQESFKKALNEAISDVNQLQKESQHKTELLVKGEIETYMM
ncbi:hypothetical protein JCM9152_588 [Halalkalibacter hemicellulosilyticusJCM 9152]|uniref:Uncharacterized protein n=1 Tax=Halalkalibacter hemicellulosilyticusJCM 9152 TaxID=1236971 RepID=W4QB05_9BACI|nr:hypothetical protein JCM9152_588 [Halalkalibacter hemicellulosilyticusJCM 9152]